MIEIEKLNSICNDLEKSFEQEKDALLAVRRKHFEAIVKFSWILEILDGYNWMEFIEILEEWSCWEASMNSCEKEVINHFTGYLTDIEKRYFDRCFIQELWREYIYNLIK